MMQNVDEFRYRQSNYKDNARKFERREHCMQNNLYDHFNLSGHSGFLSGVSVVDKTDHDFNLSGHSGFLSGVSVVDKTDHENPTKREDQWIHKLEAEVPLGRNAEDGLSALLT